MYYCGPWTGAALGFHIIGLVFWGLFLLIFLRFIFFGRHDGRGRGHRWGNPVDIAKARYAKGDITKDEYEQIVKDLT